MRRFHSRITASRGIVVVVSAVAGAALAFIAMHSHGAEAASTAHKATPINACSLLTSDEVSEVMGVKVDAGSRRDDGWVDNDTVHGAYSSTCYWRATADRNLADPNLSMGGASYAILNVFSWPPGSKEAGTFLQKFRDAAESNLIPSKPVPLKIADEALWWGDGVAVKSGNVAFGISVHLVGGRPKEQQMEETLGTQLAGRVAQLPHRR
jgi:hypothetical protein